MKKRVLSLFLALTLCLTLLPTSAFAEGVDGSAVSSETTAVEGGQPTTAGAPTEDSNSSNAGAAAEGNGQSNNTGESEQPNSETDTRTEIWCTSKPDSIGRSYDGTTDGSTILLNLTFTDGTNEIAFEEGTDFTAVKTFDSADAGNHTVTVEITLIGEAATKYKLRAGEEKFEIGGYINKAYPKLTVSLSRTTCGVGEKLLPLLFVDGVQEDAAVTYYYTPIKSGYLEFEGSDAVPKIDENTAISETGTYYVYAKTAETKNYEEQRSTTVEFTVVEKTDPVASVMAADGTETTYGSFSDAWTAAIANNGSTLKLLADGTLSDANTDISKSLTLDLNGYVLGSNGSLTVKSGAALTVKNAGGEKSETPVKVGLYLTLLVEKGGSFTCTDGKIRYLGLQDAGTGDYSIKLADGESHCAFGSFAQGDANATIGDLLKATPGMALHADDSGSDVQIERSTPINSLTYFTYHVGACSEHKIGEDGTCEYCGASYVASVTTSSGKTTNYTSLDDALKAAQNGDTVTLLSDVDLGETYVTIDKSITFDLGGKTLSSSKAWLLYSVLLVKDATVTVKNGTVKAAGDGSCAIQAYRSGASMTLEDVTATVTSGKSSVMVGDFGSAVIKSGDYQGLYVGAKSQVTLEGGTFRPYMDTITNKSVKSIFWKVNDTTDATSRDCMELLGDGCVYVDENKGQVRTGGGFNTVVTVQKGTPTGAPVAKIGDVEYASLSKAIDAVQNGGTITLLDDLDLGNGAVLRVGSSKKDFTIDLDSHTLSADGACLIMLHNGSQLTLKNGTLDGSRCTSDWGVLYISSNSGPKLTLENVTAKSGTVTDTLNGQRSVLLAYVTYGTVVFDGGTYTGGVLLKTDGNAVLKSGTFQKGDNTYSIKTEVSDKHLSDYLDSDSQFWEGNTPLDLSSVAETADEAIVHPCEHKWKNGKCTVCQKVCDHGSADGSYMTKDPCSACGMKAATQVDITGEDAKYFPNFDSALTYATRNDGCTLKLLADETGAVSINTPFIFDLNGHDVNLLSVGARAKIRDSSTTKGTIKELKVINMMDADGNETVLTVADLLEDGYAFKSNSGNTWYFETVNAISNVTVQPVPIKSVTAENPTVTVEYGKTSGVTLSATVVPATEGGTVSYQWYEIGGSLLTIEGATGSTYQLPNDLSAGEHTYRLTATSDGYPKSVDITVNVTPISLKDATVEVTNPTYNGQKQFPTVTVKFDENTTLTKDKDFYVDATMQTEAGSYTLTVKGNGNYSGEIKDVDWKIEPMKIDHVMFSKDITKTYSGSAEFSLTTAERYNCLKFYGEANSLIDVDPGDYEIDGKVCFLAKNAEDELVDSPEAGKKSYMQFTVKLLSENYVLQTPDGTAVSELTCIQSSGATFTITKETAPTQTTEVTLYVTNGLAKTYEVDLAALLPKLTMPCEYGDISYTVNADGLNKDYYTSGATVTNGKLSLPIRDVSTDKEGSIGNVTVTVASVNYENITLTIPVCARNKLTPDQTGVTVKASRITYGDSLAKSKLTVTGTMKDPYTGAEVKGAFTWTDGAAKPNAGSYEAEWTFTPAAGYEEYATATGNATVTVEPAELTGVSVKASSTYYTGKPQYASRIASGQSVDGTTVTFTYSDKVDGNYTSDGPTFTDAGTYTAYYKAEAVNHKTATGTFTVTIAPLPISLLSVSSISKTYDGSADVTLTASKLTFISKTASRQDITLPDTALSFSNAQFTKEQADGSYKPSPEVGDGKALSFTMTLEGGNYVFEGKPEGTKTNHYDFATGDATKFTITKATAPTNIQTGTLNVVNGTTLEYTYDAKQLLPNAPKGTYGTVFYAGEPSSDFETGYTVKSCTVGINSGVLTLTIDAQDGGKTGKIGSFLFSVTTDNYETFSLPIDLYAVNKITPVADGKITATKITYGDALSKSTISGKMKDPATNAAIEGTFSWQDPNTVLNASTLGHDVGWKFTPKNGNTYAEATGTATVEVDRARQYGKVSMAGYTYGETPSTPSLTEWKGDPNAQVTYNYFRVDSGTPQTWDINDPPALSAGTYRILAQISQTDNYYGYDTAYCEFVVAKATPTHTKPTGLTAKYGQKLSEIALINPEGNTPGTWNWQKPETVLEQLGTQSFYADFTPNSENYMKVVYATIDVTVGPADGGNLKTVDLTQKYTDTSEHTYTPDWSGLPTGQTWSYGCESSSTLLTKKDVSVENGKLTYAISGGNAGDTVTITLKASCNNYEDFTITLTITLTEKDNQQALRITGGTTVVYGQTLTLGTSGGSGSGAVTYTVTNGTGEATIDPNGVLTPVRVGSVTVTAAKEGDSEYNAVTSSPVEITITKATPTGTPGYTKITTSGKTLKDAALTIEGGTFSVPGTVKWELSEDTVVKTNTAYKWVFTPADAVNYTTLTGEIELYHVSSGGSSGYSYYTIKATAGTGGSISPSGNVSVREGRDQTFTITPDKGYAISDVKIDGKSIGAVKSYTFEKVKKSHTVEVSFAKVDAFADVPAGSYYEEAVNWAVENGITQGTDTSHFSPDGICTRAQTVTFLWRTAGSPEPEARTMPFTDVPAGSYYYDAVLWAVENGITKGTSDTTFSPNMTCSRAQIVTFLWRSEKSPAAGTANPFADVKSTAYYADAVLWAVKEDITKGTTNTTFSPDADCTRAQIVTFLWRCMK